MHVTLRLRNDEINALINRIENKKKTLTDKSREFVERLSLIGIPVIQENINFALGDADKSHETQIILSEKGGIQTATLQVSGEDILFIEFGAGVHFNGNPHGSPHPKGKEFGYTIGDFSDKHHGLQDSWWYTDESGNSHYSQGTQATMPMYKAAMEIRKEMIAIAKEIFEGW